jgi:hypothetical protein
MKQIFEVWEFVLDGDIKLVKPNSTVSKILGKNQGWQLNYTVELDITEPAKFKRGDKVRRTKEYVGRCPFLPADAISEIFTVDHCENGHACLSDGKWIDEVNLELAPKTVKKMQYAYGLIGSKQVSGITNIRTEGENIKAVYWYSPIPETEVEE